MAYANNLEDKIYSDTLKICVLCLKIPNLSAKVIVKIDPIFLLLVHRSQAVFLVDELRACLE